MPRSATTTRLASAGGWSGAAGGSVGPVGLGVRSAVPGLGEPEAPGWADTPGDPGTAVPGVAEASGWPATVPDSLMHPVTSTDTIAASDTSRPKRVTERAACRGMDGW